MSVIGKHSHPKSLIIAVAALLLGLPGAALAGYTLTVALLPEEAEPSIQAASAVWTRSVDITVAAGEDGASQEIVAYHFLDDAVELTATVANDGPKTTTVRGARLILDGAVAIELSLRSNPTIGPNGNQARITARVSPQDFSADAADALGCRVINAQCRDMTLHEYTIQVDFSSGTAKPQIVDARYVYAPVATCSVEDASQPPPEPCPTQEQETGR